MIICIVDPIYFNVEIVWQALDHVIAEARKHGIRLLLSLVNNLLPYGGKTQYVKWAWEEGVGLSSSNDSFFYDPSIRNYFKNHVKVIHLISFVYCCFFLPFFNQKSLGNCLSTYVGRTSCDFIKCQKNFHNMPIRPLSLFPNF